MSVSDFGLGIVILGALILVGSLLDDGYRVLTGEQTITQWTVKKAYRIYLIVGATSLIPAGLLLHFLTF